MAEATFPTEEHGPENEEASVETVHPAPLAEIWHYFTENRGAVTGLVVLVIIVLAAIFARFIAPHGPDELFGNKLLTPPVWEPAAPGSSSWAPTRLAAICCRG